MCTFKSLILEHFTQHPELQAVPLQPVYTCLLPQQAGEEGRKEEIDQRDHNSLGIWQRRLHDMRYETPDSLDLDLKTGGSTKGQKLHCLPASEVTADSDVIGCWTVRTSTFYRKTDIKKCSVFCSSAEHSFYKHCKNASESIFIFWEYSLVTIRAARPSTSPSDPKVVSRRRAARNDSAALDHTSEMMMSPQAAQKMSIFNILQNECMVRTSTRMLDSCHQL